MPFQAGQSGNPNGRPIAERLVNPKSVSGNEIREKEFKQMLRGLKPLTRKALRHLEDVLDSKDTSEATRMKAIALVLHEYEKLMNEVYKPIVSPTGKFNDDADKDPKELEQAPIVSLHVLPKQTG